MSGSAGDLGPAERAVLLAFADDEHLMGQRHTEWIGVAPFLEEDLAFSSIAQDELGHATMLYELVDPGADVDTLALGRAPADYRSCWLVEAPCTDWAEALVRHWLYDTAEELRWSALADSSHDGVRGTAARALNEERYHRRHADALLDAIEHDREARVRVGTALASLLPAAAAMFDAPAGGEEADRTIVGAPFVESQSRWGELVDRRFGAQAWAGVEPPSSDGRTLRSTEFAEVYARMREVIALDPSARW